MTMKSRAKYFAIGSQVETPDGIQGEMFSFDENKRIGVMKSGGRFILVSLDTLQHRDNRTVDPGYNFNLPF